MYRMLPASSAALKSYATVGLIVGSVLGLVFGVLMTYMLMSSSSACAAPWIRSMERELGRVTGPRSCGIFVDRHVPGKWSAKAIANRSLGRPSSCRPGAVAVMHGHVGVIHRAGCRAGRCSVISGNGRGGRVDVKSYPRSRIVACRWPR